MVFSWSSGAPKNDCTCGLTNVQAFNLSKAVENDQCGIIEFLVIDRHIHTLSIDNYGWEQFILFSLNYRYTAFLGHHLNWTQQRTIKNGIGHPGIQELVHLSFTHPAYWG